MSTIRSLSLCFAAGAVGGLANGAAVWLCGQLGVTEALGVSIAPELTAAFLYPRVVWGGLWGLLFALPLRTGWVKRGLLLGLAPALVQLLVVFPLKAHQGVLGLDLGALTPCFVLFFNAVWGVVASGWVRSTGA